MADISGPRNPFEDPDLRRRLLLTLGALTLFRVGTYLPLPGVDADALKALVDAQTGGPLGFLNAFTGGALGRGSLFALGVVPYVNASIVAGFLKRGRRERDAAARRLTLFLALLQSFALVLVLPAAGPGWMLDAATVPALTAGAMFVLWLCEEITESGVGGGALLIVLAGLLGSVLSGAGELFRLVRVEELGLFSALAIVAALLAFVLAAVWVETAQRKLAVHYAQRVVGRRMYGGSSSVLPLKLEQAGVVAAVWTAVGTASLAALLLAAARLFSRSPVQRLSSLLSRGSWLDDAVYAVLIVLFCVLAGSKAGESAELAENLKKSGGSIPGIRPGDSTARHIQWIHERAALGGALLVAAIAVLPDLLRRGLRLPFFFDGLALLVVVGAALDAMGRVEAHGMRRAYAKFLK